jgi:NAD(P)-dependent dehydrogenase (short-subunit alcohol dehydrogenase family)
MGVLEDKVVLVTGAASGIGLRTAERCAAEGASVVLADRAVDRLPAALETVNRLGGQHCAISLDVTREADWTRGITQVESDYGRLDVLVNNAGGSPPADSATASPKFSSAIITLNLVAPLLFAQRANAVMQTQPEGGTIVNIASVSGIRPSPGAAAYGAAKAGLINLTQTLAVDYAPKVRVNAVTAGLVRTEQSHLFYGDEEGIAAVGATVPLGRMADPSDIADVCLFLASPLAGYVSGENIVVHGGGERPAYLDAAKNTRP